MLTTAALLLAGAGSALAASSVVYPSRPAESTIAPSLAQIVSAAATAQAESPSTNIKGVAFDRIMHIWLENIDYNTAAADPNMQWIASQGITLTNYFAVTHPSEPNYCAAAGGDYFGMENDDFHAIPSNISTIADLLDTKGISWGEYQEHAPYAGYQGFNYSNQKSYANDYVRKHSPLVLYTSVTNNATRLGLLKNFTALTSDIAAKSLPQWSFITPNMTNDAHDTNITYAGKWARNFLPELLNNSYVMNNTVIAISFDESGNYTTKNNVFTVLLGGAIPDSLKGTKDNTFYTHYSMIASVSANWGLPSLGRYDCGANLLEMVANKTGYVNAVIDITNFNPNSSYPGPLSDAKFTPGVWPAPVTNSKCSAGNGVLPAVVNAWKSAPSGFAYSSNYTLPVPFDFSSSTGLGVVISKASSLQANSSSSTGSSTSAAPSAAKTGAASSINAVGAGVAVVVAAVGAAMML